MNKTASVVVGVVVVAGIAWVGASYYTGTQVEKELQASIAKLNEQIKTSAPGTDLTFALASFERGAFSSNARYSVKARYGAAKTPAEFILTDHIEHGPFPLGRLKSGHIGPVMATSHAQLEKNADSAGWFAATKEVAPFVSDVSISYGNNIDGTIKFAAAEVQKNDLAFKFSGLTLDVDADRNGERARVNGSMDTLTLSGKSRETGEPFNLAVAGLALASDMKLGATQLYTGSSDLTIKAFTLAPEPARPVVLNGYAQRVKLDDAGGKYAANVAYEVAMVSVAGKDIAGGQFVVGAKNLDPVAVKALSDVYRQAATRRMRESDDNATQGLLPEETAQFQAAIESLLAASPSITIDPLLVKTDKGEGRFTLALDLTKPAQPAAGFTTAIQQSIRKLDARLQIAKPMIAGLLTQSMVQPGQDAAQAAQQATAQTEMIGGMALQSGIAKVEGDNLVSTLNYADGQVDFNGKKMPLAQFMQMVMSLAMGGMAR